MKISRIVLAVLFALAASANTLRAVPPFQHLAFMRTAKANSSFLLSLAAASFPYTGVLMSDPGPGGLSSALAFTAHPLAAPFPEGDVVLLDASGHVSDILRFDPETNPGPGAPQLIFFYSNDHRGLLADTGLPSLMYEQHGHYSGEPVRSNHLYPNCRPARLLYRFASGR